MLYIKSLVHKRTDFSCNLPLATLDAVVIVQKALDMRGTQAERKLSKACY